MAFVDIQGNRFVLKPNDGLPSDNREWFPVTVDGARQLRARLVELDEGEVIFAAYVHPHNFPHIPQEAFDMLADLRQLSEQRKLALFDELVAVLGKCQPIVEATALDYEERGECHAADEFYELSGKAKNLLATVGVSDV